MPHNVLLVKMDIMVMEPLNVLNVQLVATNVPVLLLVVLPIVNLVIMVNNVSNVLLTVINVLKKINVMLMDVKQVSFTLNHLKLVPLKSPVKVINTMIQPKILVTPVELIV